MTRFTDSPSPFYHIYGNILSWVSMGLEEVNARTLTRIRVGRGGVSFRIDLRDGILPTIGWRKTFPRSAAAEVAWFLLGTQDATFIHKYAPLWDKFVEEVSPGVVGVKAAYGYRWSVHFGRDQLQLAIDTLHADPTDRRCYVAAWDPENDGLGVTGQKNVPCPVGFTLSVHNGELHSSLMLRSADIFVGLPYDVMGHALLMDAVASELGVTVGIMHITLAHAHLYENHWRMAEETLIQVPVLPRFRLPGWTVTKIVQHPDAYVAYIAAVAKRFEWPSYNPHPHVVV